MTATSTVHRKPTVIPDAAPEGEGQPDPNPDERAGALLRPVEGETSRTATGAAPETEDPRAGSVPTPAGPAPRPRRGRLKAWVIVVVAVAALALLAFASTYSPLFAAHTVRVEGVDHLRAEQVRRIARIGSGVNVFRLDTAQAERRLERNAWVAGAEITTRLPSEVTIVVLERTPAAIVATDAVQGRALVAGDGTILAPVHGSSALPLVASADGDVVPDDAQRTLGATVAGSLPRSIVAEVETVSVGGDGSVGLVLSDGVLVSYGDGTGLAAKGQALRAVLLWAEREGVRFVSVDVRTPGAPTASLGGGVTVVPRV